METGLSDYIYKISYKENGEILLNNINSKEFKFYVDNQVNKKLLLDYLKKIVDPTDEFIVCKIKEFQRFLNQNLIQTLFNSSDFLLHGKIQDILSKKLPSGSVLIPLKLLIKNLQLEICHPEKSYLQHTIRKIKDNLLDEEINITSECGVTMNFFVYDDLCTAHLTFTPRFPSEPAGIMLTKPFTYVFPKVHVDLQNHNPSLKEDIMNLTKDLLEKASVITRRLPQITDTAYLVIGGHPYEERNGRTHYDNPNVFFIDNLCEYDTQYYKHDQFIHLDISSPVQLGILAGLLPNKFDEICFDKSTFKFFRSDIEYEQFSESIVKNHDIRENLNNSMLLERLSFLTRMLKDTGKMFISDVEGDTWVGEEQIRNMAQLARQNREKVVDYCQRAGSNVEFKTVGEIGHTSVLVPLLYGGRRARWELQGSIEPSQRVLLVAHKTTD